MDSFSLGLPLLRPGEQVEFSLQLGSEVAEVLLVKSMSQTQVEGKEESEEKTVSAQSGHHPQHCQQLHTNWVA